VQQSGQLVRVAASVDEQDVSNIDGWEALIGRDLLDQLSDLEGQLNRKVIECPGAADLADRGDDLSKAASPASAL
jgi:hypothetical protein